MSSQYLFPCKCGHPNLISVSDAGKTIDCEQCGVQIELPGMRDIKKLEPHVATDAGARKEKNWTYEKGLFFSFGFGAVCIGLIAAAICIYIGRVNFPSQKPEIRGDWNQVGSMDPPVDTPVWAYTSTPEPGGLQYELTIFDRESQKWVFENPDREHQPRDYFSKWGNSYQAGIESSVHRSSMQDLWKFWYETEPNEPLKEWQEPMYSINGRFATIFYSFAGVGGLIAVVGAIMVVYSVSRR